LTASGIGFAAGIAEPEVEIEKFYCVGPSTSPASASCGGGEDFTGKAMAGGSFCLFPPTNCS
jgi:hypothetical protein